MPKFVINVCSVHVTIGNYYEFYVEEDIHNPLAQPQTKHGLWIA